MQLRPVDGSDSRHGSILPGSLKLYGRTATIVKARGRGIMSIRKRCYRHPGDVEPIGGFLFRTYPVTRDGPHRNWLQPRWEYAHYHPWLDTEHLDRWAVWEADRRIVGVVHYEHHMGLAYVQLDPAVSGIRREMLEHAARHLRREVESGAAVDVYLDDDDEAFRREAAD